MRTTLLVSLALLILSNLTSAQSLLQMEKLNGIQVMPCKVNDLTLKFIIDTGEKEARISVTDAMFMLKNGYIDMDDITGTEYERFAAGHIGNGTTVKIKKFVIGHNVINNLIAKVDPDLKTPLVIGQSVLYKIGKIEFDYGNQLVTINNYNNNNLQINTAKNDYSTIPSLTGVSSPIVPVKNTSAGMPAASAIEPTPSKNQKVLVKVKTNLYTKPENGQMIAQVNSNCFVYLIGDATPDQNFLFVDYMGHRGYINRLALEQTSQLNVQKIP